MIFNSFNFIVLFPIIFLLYYLIPIKCRKVRNLYLLVVSYLLYIQWKPVCALCLLGITVVTFFSAITFEHTKHNKWVLILAVLLSLLPLAFLKYFNFINNSLCYVLSFIGINYHLPGLNWAIPVGLSFLHFKL